MAKPENAFLEAARDYFTTQIGKSSTCTELMAEFAQIVVVGALCAGILD